MNGLPENSFAEAADPGFLRMSFAAPGAPAAYLSLLRAGDMGFGNDGNRARRAQWLRGVGLNPELAISPDLIHSRSVIAASQPADAMDIDADGVIVPGDAHTGACVAITVADCMPIFLFDAGTGAFGLLHSGWKGTGILAEAVGLMGSRYSSAPRDIHAIFGPRIGTCCYIVDDERAAIFSGEFGQGAVVMADGKPRLDLVAANLALADRLALASVRVIGGCTACDGRFGSFRREGPKRFTRMAAAIGYTEGR